MDKPSLAPSPEINKETQPVKPSNALPEERKSARPVKPFSVGPTLFSKPKIPTANTAKQHHKHLPIPQTVSREPSEAPKNKP